MLGRVDAITGDIATLDAGIEEEIAPFAAAVRKLDEVPGISLATARDPGQNRAGYDSFPLRRAPGVLGEVRARRNRIGGQEEGRHRPQ
jgi:hypothetical protein